MNKSILIIGACGQIGTELTLKLRKNYGKNAVIASDISEGNEELMASGPFEFINALDYGQIAAVIDKYAITEVYLMAAMLSAIGEKFPAKAWDLNMNSLLNVLNLAKEGKIRQKEKIFTRKRWSRVGYCEKSSVSDDFTPEPLKYSIFQ